MSDPLTAAKSAVTTRRDFLKTSAALAGTAVLGELALSRSAHAAGSDAIKIGLIGCGGRGTGAAANALNAGPDIRVVALADVFPDKLQGALKSLKTKKPGQVAVMAVAAQMAIYSGQAIPWEKAEQSKRSFALERYALGVTPPVKPGPDGRYATAMQGKTEYDKWLLP